MVEELIVIDQRHRALCEYGAIYMLYNFIIIDKYDKNKLKMW